MTTNKSAKTSLKAQKNAEIEQVKEKLGLNLPLAKLKAKLLDHALEQLESNPDLIEALLTPEDPDEPKLKVNNRIEAPKPKDYPPNKTCQYPMEALFPKGYCSPFSRYPKTRLPKTESAILAKRYPLPPGTFLQIGHSPVINTITYWFKLQTCVNGTLPIIQHNLEAFNKLKAASENWRYSLNLTNSSPIQRLDGSFASKAVRGERGEFEPTPKPFKGRLAFYDILGYCKDRQIPYIGYGKTTSLGSAVRPSFVKAQKGRDPYRVPAIPKVRKAKRDGNAKMIHTYLRLDIAVIHEALRQAVNGSGLSFKFNPHCPIEPESLTSTQAKREWWLEVAGIDSCPVPEDDVRLVLGKSFEELRSGYETNLYALGVFARMSKSLMGQQGVWGDLLPDPNQPIGHRVKSKLVALLEHTQWEHFEDYDLRTSVKPEGEHLCLRWTPHKGLGWPKDYKISELLSVPEALAQFSRQIPCTYRDNNGVVLHHSGVVPIEESVLARHKLPTVGGFNYIDYDYIEKERFQETMADKGLKGSLTANVKSYFGTGGERGSNEHKTLFAALLCSNLLIEKGTFVSAAVWIPKTQGAVYGKAIYRLGHWRTLLARVARNFKLPVVYEGAASSTLPLASVDFEAYTRHREEDPFYQGYPLGPENLDHVMYSHIAWYGIPRLKHLEARVGQAPKVEPLYSMELYTLLMDFCPVHIKPTLLKFLYQPNLKDAETLGLPCDKANWGPGHIQILYNKLRGGGFDLVDEGQTTL